MEPSALLSVQSIGRQIADRWIWKDLTFSIYPGDRLAIVGASGTGKSLLLRAIAFLDPLQAGQIIFQDKPVSAWSVPAYRTHVMYLQQRPAFPEGTVEQVLQQVYTFKHHRHRQFERDRILALLEILGRNGSFLKASTRSLSGGESQIVAFLRALQLSPTILLLDEPTASLDPETAQQVERLVETWQSEDPRRAYLWTSHSPEQIQRVTHRAIALSSSADAMNGSSIY